MTEDRFLENLRRDARPLQYEPADPFALRRMSARIQERMARPTVTELLARWFRPIAASVSALAVMASIGFVVFERSNDTFTLDDPPEISMAGDLYSVGQ